MKLQLKLLLISIGAISVAVTISCIAVLSFSKRNLLSEEVDQAAQDYSRFSSAFDTIPAKQSWDSEIAAKSYIIRHFRDIAGSTEFSLQKGADVYSNNTGIDSRKLLDQIRYKQYTSLPASDSIVQYYFLNLESKTFLIMYSLVSIGDDSYDLSLVRDVSHVIENIRALGIKCVAVGTAISLITAFIVWRLIILAFKPLRLMRSSADLISHGQYQSRITIAGGSEISDLAKSFNHMAESIELQITGLETANKEKEFLLAAISHEMKTPVTAIIGYAHALRHAKMSDRQKQEAVFYIDSECRRLERLSGKLIQLITLQNIQLITSKVPAQELADRLEIALRQSAHLANIQLDFELESGTEYDIEIDLVLCLITNFYDNSRKANATSVLVRFDKDELSVRDNGSGIQKEHLDKILRPFYKIDESRSSEGFGLGLSLCKLIVDLHRAKLSIDSVYGEGTTIKISF